MDLRELTGNKDVFGFEIAQLQNKPHRALIMRNSGGPPARAAIRRSSTCAPQA